MPDLGRQAIVDQTGLALLVGFVIFVVVIIAIAWAIGRAGGR